MNSIVDKKPRTRTVATGEQIAKNILLSKKAVDSTHGVNRRVNHGFNPHICTRYDRIIQKGRRLELRLSKEGKNDGTSNFN